MLGSGGVGDDCGYAHVVAVDPQEAGGFCGCGGGDAEWHVTAEAVIAAEHICFRFADLGAHPDKLGLHIRCAGAVLAEHPAVGGVDEPAGACPDHDPGSLLPPVMLVVEIRSSRPL